ncbi:FkbM family methyltransferase [Natronobeatus ordinarius]|uniref:FkbM family methyltransferase n=1 Tax=Natronobeatus ordinarius TaxID=2963433 RepID=UPI0020CCE645|nr:FkbM family methyltransferase [Natronobeatus ordinarius]
MASDVGIATRAFYRARGVAYGVYHRLTRANYEREWLARANRTPAGTFRCYEPLPRHGDDRMLAELADHCGPADVIYDVGANVGVYALALASGAPDRRVVAFEPAPSTVDRLRANVRLNGLEDRIDVHACGLGHEAGERPFYRSTYPELSAFDPESASRWEASVAGVVTVSVQCLDDLSGSLPAPDVLKLDVEGAAPAVLRGGRETLERHRPTIFLEVHEDGLEGDVPGELRSLFADRPYVVQEREGYWRCDPDDRVA